MKSLFQRIIVCSVFLLLFACDGILFKSEREKSVATVAGHEFVLGKQRYTPPRGVTKELLPYVSKTSKQRAQLSKNKYRDVHVLVQFRNPLTLQDLKVLNARGIKIYNKINNYTWIAGLSVAGAKTLDGLEIVHWADIYPVTAKLSQDINEQKPFKWQLRDSNKIAYSVLFHDDVKTEEISRLQESLPGMSLEGFSAKAFTHLKAVTVVINKGDLNKLASYDIVRWIEPLDPPYVPSNQANTQPLSNVDDVQGAPYNLSGTGVSIGIWEATEAGTNGIIRNTHQELTGRATLASDQTVPTPAVYSDHATHVAGTVASSGANSPATEGMAPASTIVSWSSANDSTEMTNAATSAGGAGDPVPIVISNHSYGFDLGWSWNGTSFSGSGFTRFGQYRAKSSAHDSVVLNTDLTVVFAAGNERNDQWDGVTVIPGAPAATRDCTQGGLAVDADCIPYSATAKNIITVGAMNGAGAIAGFSSFGPTDDGRIKPDIMAHGVSVTSLRGTSNTATTQKSGTSMASPAVAGMAALLVEQATTLGITLSPAAIKALLIQSAQDVAVVGQATVGPDYSTGWGIADVQAAADLLRLQGGAGLAQESISVTGAAGAYNHPFYVPAGLAETHVSIAWSDQPGNSATPSGAQLVNDLDLRLIAPDGTVFTPWTLNPANPGTAATRNGGDDAINNVEQVSVLTPADGVWIAQVTAKAGSLVTGAQDFAMAGPLTPAAGPIASVKADVILVMDRSGSMSLASGTPGLNKLAALKSSATEFLDFMELVGGHQVGLVQFDTNVAAFVPAFDLQTLDAGSIAAARTAVDAMTTGNSTNIIDGVTTAEGQLIGPSAANPNKVVFLFSDGKHNSPFGSDVSTIDGIMAAETKFYAIGFGTDVDSTVMPTVASNHDGLYLEEQTLTAAQLSKMFLTIAGLTVDESIVIDPDYPIAPGQSIQQNVYLTSADRAVTFATHWNTSNVDQMNVYVTGPDKRCKIPAQNHAGYKTRNGEHYRLIRIKLPYSCGKSGPILHEGNWRLHVRNKGSQQDTAKVMVLADSDIDLQADVKVKGNFAYITTKLTKNKKRIKGKAKMYAALARRLPSTGDSKKQDALGAKVKSGFRLGTGVSNVGGLVKGKLDVMSIHPKQMLKLPKARSTSGNKVFDTYQVVSDKPQLIQFNDKGKLEDVKSSDGIYTAIIKINRRGFYQARIISEMETGKGTVTREIPISFLIK